ncbi:transcription-repair coupling factor [Proteinivorax hydrogeniformans]|uniref:Transcription-repair-coupling factor n=1 Tax=Proteinivorax hydrogeniformans TaxID=1826727 RepID=A0AAU8HTS0_9FIRM
MLNLLSGNAEYKKIIENITKNKSQLVYGLSGGQKGFVLANIIKEEKCKLLILVNDKANLEKLRSQLQGYINEESIVVFPQNPMLPGEVDHSSKDIELQRIKTLAKIANEEVSAVIATATSALEFLPNIDFLKSKQVLFETDKEYDFEKISTKLTQSGYKKVDVVENKGQYTIRGDILDVYPVTKEAPLRLEFFGEQLETIKYFDISSQRSQKKVEKVQIFPATLTVLDEEGQTNLLKQLEDKLRTIKDITLRDKISGDIEKVQNKVQFNELNQYNYLVYKNPQSLVDILSHYVVALDETMIIRKELKEWEQDAKLRIKSLIESGKLIADIPLYFESEDFWRKLRQKTALHFTLLLRSMEGVKLDQSISLPFRQTPVFAGQVNMFFSEVKDMLKQGFKVYISYTTDSNKQKILKGLEEYNISTKVLDNKLVFHHGDIEEGFIYDGGQVAVFTENQIFKTSYQANKRKPKQSKLQVTDVSKLQIGDYVVHTSHGIGIFKGVKTLEVAGGKKDYIHLQYAKQDKLYVPLDQLEPLQKYIGSEGKEPKVNSLSGGEWSKITSKTKKSVEEMAEKLIELYAKRKSSQGHKFSADSTFQNQFEESFPYKETKDQHSAIKDTKADMMSSFPMERLLCGDVGYGKTEVALRAAMKAVLESKQVVVLVPTTVLAQQHYKTFIERFSDFPVNVEVFSRFRSKKQIQEGLVKLATGEVDIAIGTHRLLQKDVDFKDLGLMIIDEEQRFGVTHKEKLKQMKENIDVLMLSATPIPRTLHMSMLGIKDLSVIETPPEDRFPVQTYVLEYNKEAIRAAIKRELNRGGQVYFVYNKVSTISKMANDLQQMIPDARIAIGHGQMSETKLEKTMLEFLEGKHDILLSTTIIETGLDIPNVNTLIIYDADKFGLSQLYQIRGRVGRSKRLAYCYLTYQKDKVLTEIAQKRLQAIKEFTELGSGFKIAMRDLELRGAGNILGAEQHGFMVKVGFDLYCQMLEDAVDKLKGKPVKERPLEVSLEFPLPSYIPDKLMNDSLKVSFYRRISQCQTFTCVEVIEDELMDRFGRLTEPVENLLHIARLKVLAQKLKIKRIKCKSLGYINTAGNEYSIEIKFYEDKVDIDGRSLLELKQKNRKLEFSTVGGLTVGLKKIKKADVLHKTEELLHSLTSCEN